MEVLGLPLIRINLYTPQKNSSRVRPLVKRGRRPKGATYSALRHWVFWLTLFAQGGILLGLAHWLVVRQVRFPFRRAPAKFTFRGISRSPNSLFEERRPVEFVSSSHLSEEDFSRALFLRSVEIAPPKPLEVSARPSLSSRVVRSVLNPRLLQSARAAFSSRKVQRRRRKKRSSSKPPRRKSAPRVSRKGSPLSSSSAGGGEQARRGPSVVYGPPPRYPYRARRRGYEGRVFLRIYVSSRGYPQKIVVLRSSGYRSLDEAAVRAVQRWRFQPARRGGREVGGIFEIAIRFQLQ
ncbi:MAG: energy transducer TonB [Planctomycetota bacterium]|nr:MAG: energy transducer TonB [Planctomycetota bacterium]